jgi:predicted RNase H-like nuclease (RuvC/YqgF family)
MDFKRLREAAEGLNREELICNLITMERHKEENEKLKKENRNMYDGRKILDDDLAIAGVLNENEKLKDELEEFKKMIDFLPNDMDEYYWDTEKEIWKHEDDRTSEDESMSE